MKCPDCGGNFIKLNNTYELNDRYVGKITILGVPYYKCDNNGEILFTLEMTEAIEQERKRLIQAYLKKYSIGDFISAQSAWKLLGISRQALNKNRRIRKGFIYTFDFNGFLVYLKQSVILFKNTGDGRFPLFQQTALPDEEKFVTHAGKLKPALSC
jgi:hypothetical protein